MVLVASNDRCGFAQVNTCPHLSLPLRPLPDVTVGSHVTIGGLSCIMPGACVEDGATLGDVTLVMKGEVVPSGSNWCGVPALPTPRGAAPMFD